MLHVNETNNAFLSGPLELRPDVTLIVGLRRHALRLARSGGFRGFARQLRHCEPRPDSRLQAADLGRPRAQLGVMGDGVIDGRGGEKMLGSQYSWWDLAQQARDGGGQQVPRLIVATTPTTSRSTALR
jgi:polygalacturonase